MASGKPYVFRPFRPDVLVHLYRQTACDMTEKQSSVFIGSLCDCAWSFFFCCCCWNAGMLLVTSTELLCAQFKHLCMSRFSGVSLITVLFPHGGVLICAKKDCRLYCSCLNNLDHLKKIYSDWPCKYTFQSLLYF